MNKYLSHSKQLFDELQKIENSVQVVDFANKYRIWSAFFDEVLEKTSGTVSPKIHSLIASSRIVALCGMAEGFIYEKIENKEKFFKFINFLNPIEKLFFSLAFTTKTSVNVEAEKFQKQYQETGDVVYFDKLIELSENSDNLHHEEVSRIMSAFIADDFTSLDKFFNEKAELLYGIRSKIVHSGSPDVIGAMLANSVEAIMFYGERRGIFFTIKYPLEEFFLRAAIRASGNEPKKLQPDEFLWDKYISHHANKLAIISNKLK